MSANDLPIAHQEYGCRIAFANRAELGFFKIGVYPKRIRIDKRNFTLSNIASPSIHTAVQASRHGIDAKLSKHSGLEKGQNVGIDNIGMNRKHAVRVPRIDLESRVLDQLRLKQDGVLVRYDLIVISLHHQGRNVDCL